MSQKSKILSLVAMAAAHGMYSSIHGYTQEEMDKWPVLHKKKEPPIPKGCKVYYFTSNGEISDTPTDCKVIAINEKNALKKYKNR